jgi:putative transposase
VADGIQQGRKPELMGGGLKRSLAGTLQSPSGVELYDERVLGSGSFIEQLRYERELREKLLANMKLPELMQRVENHYGLQAGRLAEQSRNKETVAARDVFCHLSVRILFHSGAETGRFLNIGRSAASHAVRRGGKIVSEHPDLLDDILAQSR